MIPSHNRNELSLIEMEAPCIFAKSIKISSLTSRKITEYNFTLASYLILDRKPQKIKIMTDQTAEKLLIAGGLLLNLVVAYFFFS